MIQHYLKSIFISLFSLVGISISAQTTILNETLLTQESFSTFTGVSVTGTQAWYFSPVYGAVCNGYAGGQSYANEDWFVSPAMNLSQMNDVKLTFDHTRGNASVLNVGVSQGWYKVFATANYSGNPSTTTWVELTGVDHNVPVAWQYISSGDLTIPQAAKSAASRIAFKYVSSATQSATWEIKNVQVTVEPQSNPNTASFKITTWNTEWLGCTSEGPEDEALQLSNVASAMLAMNSDIYCIQEVTNNQASPTIATLVSLLGSDQWDGRIVSADPDGCDQRQAILFKKARVQFVNASMLNTGSNAQNNTYYYNWSSGRYPAVYNVNLLSGNSVVPVSIINIHAKAEDGNAMSYTRRLGASEALKAILDGPAYNSKNVMVIGDFNDYLLGTNSSSCNCSSSPYQNFMNDPQRYAGITQSILATGGNPTIQNLFVSNELASNYISGSAVREMSVPQSIGGYYNTTSNHVPISARFEFSTLSDADFVKADEKALNVYPNPVADELKISGADLQIDAVQVFDLAGRAIRFMTENADTIDVSNLPSGIYVLRVGTKSTRFIKH